MSDIEQIVRQMVTTSQPGNDLTLISAIETIIDGESSKLIARVLRDKYTTEDAKIVNVEGSACIVSPWNVEGIKFKGDGVKFGYDFINDTVIDVEKYECSFEVKKFQKQLNSYVAEYYVSGCGVVVEEEDGYTFVVVGEKLNDGNFYNGRWVGVYKIKGNEMDVDIRVKIHYYEDGNVVLKSECTQNGVAVGGDVFTSIEEAELDTEVKILSKVKELNENKFKNLRRLMPVSRSRIQWGRSIGNYKLGKDVVNK